VAAGSELVFARLGPSVPYLDAWDLQRRLHDRRCAGQNPDCCLLLEHEPVYTAGKRTDVLDRPAGDPGAPVIDVDRGGKITWHGPGQLVGYPIVALADPIDVVAYVRLLEEALIRTCADAGVATGRVDGRSGVWVSGAPAGPDRKVAAIGIRVARGVTMHGFALNCDCDLSWYDRIVPCGIRDAQVTTLSAEAGRAVTVDDVIPAVQRHLADAVGAASWRAVRGTHGLLAPAPGTAQPPYGTFRPPAPAGGATARSR
jgi:lipoyl(octanoyl) transferase